MQMIFCAKMLGVITCNKWSNLSNFTVYCIKQLSKTPARFLMNKSDFLAFFNDSYFNLKILNMFQF